MEQRDVVQHLVAIVPSVQGAVARVVVQHGDVRVLVLEGNVDVLVRGRVGGVGVVHLGASGVAVGDVERPADHERLPGAPFGVVGGPALDDLQRVGVQLADDDVAGVLVGAVDGPQAPLVHHQVNVGVAAPGVVVGVVEAGVVELAGLADGGRAEVELDDDVALELVEVDGAVVDHLARPRPRVGQPVGGEVVRSHEIVHRPVLPHETVVVVTVHVPNLEAIKNKKVSWDSWENNKKTPPPQRVSGFMQITCKGNQSGLSISNPIKISTDASTAKDEAAPAHAQNAS